MNRDTRHARTPPPRAHWLVLLALALVTLVLLTVAGFIDGASAEGPRDPASLGTRGVPDTALRGAPIVDARTGAGSRVPARTIVLTFDDGPSHWTPRILDVLEQYHVPATFFVIGESVGGRADILRRMVADGDEIGVHTFTHPDLGTVGATRERLELQSTQLAIASATGYLTDLLRLPYSSTPTAIDSGQWRAVRRAGPYRVVFTDLDTRDWARPGPAAIVRAATPEGDAGAVVMLHDGGGDRAQTVAALRTLIPALLARGYRFNTVSHAIGVGSPWIAASGWQRLRGSVAVGLVLAARGFTRVVSVLFFVAGAIAVLRVLVLVFFARRHHVRVRGEAAAVGDPPPLSVIVPAYNEAAGI
ncbi:MAG: polysaccharide deacetylase family protein, partial [Jatrophihabitans sp.]|uniref:polysaccharide deacetylase family protein n=1 Tax=Jatrophihabitans sp. TaxID=1932789 RepID=UPI003F7ED9B4